MCLGLLIIFDFLLGIDSYSFRICKTLPVHLFSIYGGGSPIVNVVSPSDRRNNSYSSHCENGLNS